jgi:hypothetical protein
MSEPATKQDLKDLERDLKQFILEREIKAIRWFIALQTTYFLGTMAMVYFILSRLPH